MKTGGCRSQQPLLVVEAFGFIGRREVINCLCVCLLSSSEVVVLLKANESY
jgi:hypothetical protein